MTIEQFIMGRSRIREHTRIAHGEHTLQYDHVDGYWGAAGINWFFYGGELWCQTSHNSAYSIHAVSRQSHHYLLPSEMDKRPDHEVGLLVRLDFQPVDRRRWGKYRCLLPTQFAKLDAAIANIVTAHVHHAHPWDGIGLRHCETRIIPIDAIHYYERGMEKVLQTFRMVRQSTVWAMEGITVVPYKKRRPCDLYSECAMSYSMEPLPERLRPIGRSEE